MYVSVLTFLAVSCDVLVFMFLWLLNVLAASEVYISKRSGETMYLLPHQDRSYRSNLLSDSVRGTDTGPTSPSSDFTTPGVRQGVLLECKFG